MKTILIWIAEKLMRFGEWVNNECLKDGQLTFEQHDQNAAEVVKMKSAFRKLKHKKKP